MNAVILYYKVLEDRLQEYNDLFESCNGDSLKTVWCEYLRKYVDQSGWQAIWWIPRHKCECLEIAFPAIILASILKVNYETLDACIQVKSVLKANKIDQTKSYLVPLIELWPTGYQDRKQKLTLENTANTLDMLRFFYFYLHVPGDNENPAIWKKHHLEVRLNFYYSIKNKNIPKYAAKYISSLLMDVHSLQIKRDILEADLIPKPEPYHPQNQSLLGKVYNNSDTFESFISKTT